MQKVAIIGTVGIPSKYGGFETLAHQITSHLNRQFKFRVYCSSKAYSINERQQVCNGAELVYIPLNANGVQSVAYDLCSIIHALFFADVLLILGVSGCLFLPLVKWFTNVKVITNIDGLEWRRNKWNGLAKSFLKFSEFMAVKFSHQVITDNVAIQQYVYRKYGVKSTFIAYGGDHAKKQNVNLNFLSKFQLVPKKYAFKVARIEPENNIHLILCAFHNAKQKLVVVGNWDASQYGVDLKKKYLKSPYVQVIDPIYVQENLDQLRQNCKQYIHGHSAGGTNPSLVEAMSLGLPVLAFDVIYNRETTLNKACFFKDELDLQHQVRSLSNTALINLGTTMEEVAKKNYSWALISAKYASSILKLEASEKRQFSLVKSNQPFQRLRLGYNQKLTIKK